MAPAAPKPTSQLSKAEAIEEAKLLNIPLTTIHITEDDSSKTKPATRQELIFRMRTFRAAAKKDDNKSSKQEAKKDDIHEVHPDSGRSVRDKIEVSACILSVLFFISLHLSWPAGGK